MEKRIYGDGKYFINIEYTNRIWKKVFSLEKSQKEWENETADVNNTIKLLYINNQSIQPYTNGYLQNNQLKASEAFLLVLFQWKSNKYLCERDSICW